MLNGDPGMIKKNLRMKNDERIYGIYNQYVKGSNYTNWVRDVIYALATERKKEYDCSNSYFGYNTICSLEDIGIAQISDCKVLRNLPDSLKPYFKDVQPSLW